MKKKGFTLVELLAVIAILAILVIIALPNVLGMFNQAKKSTFVTEIQSIYDTAQKQFISNQMGSMSDWSKGIAYGRINGNRISADPVNGDNGFIALDLDGTTSIDFYIHFTLAGSVDRFIASDGEFQYIYIGPGLSKDDIVNVKIATDGKTTPPKYENTLVATFGFGTEGNTFNTSETGEVNTGVISLAEANSAGTNLAWTEVKFDSTASVLKVELTQHEKSTN